MADRRLCQVALDATFVDALSRYCLDRNLAPGDVIERAVCAELTVPEALQVITGTAPRRCPRCQAFIPAAGGAHHVCQQAAGRPRRIVDFIEAPPCPSTTPAPAPTPTAATVSAGSTAHGGAPATSESGAAAPVAVSSPAWAAAPASRAPVPSRSRRASASPRPARTEPPAPANTIPAPGAEALLRRDTDGSNAAREAALVARPVTLVDPVAYLQERAARPAPFKSQITPPTDARTVIAVRKVGSNPEGF